VIVATLAAYAIARLEFKGKKLVLSMALIIAMFPVVALVGPLFDMWRTFGIYDTWIGLIIPYMSFTLPLAIWTLSAFFREIPWEMEQAAQVDGATSWQAFRRVIVPLAAPGVFTAAILTFFFAWNDFVFGISLTSTEAARPIPASLAFFVGSDPFNRPASLLSAAAVIATIPIIIIVLLFQRKIVAGLTSGAVKG
jgi:multiple sugar transport system permease protein